MKKNIIYYIEAHGIKYPLAFDLTVIERLQEKYGYIDIVLNKLSLETNEIDIDAIIDILSIMMQEGIKLYNIKGLRYKRSIAKNVIIDWLSDDKGFFKLYHVVNSIMKVLVIPKEEKEDRSKSEIQLMLEEEKRKKGEIDKVENVRINTEEARFFLRSKMNYSERECDTSNFTDFLRYKKVYEDTFDIENILRISGKTYAYLHKRADEYGIFENGSDVV